MTGKARSTNKKHQKVPKRVMMIGRGAYLDKRGGQGMSTMVRLIPTLSKSEFAANNPNWQMLITPIPNPVNPGPNCHCLSPLANPIPKSGSKIRTTWSLRPLQPTTGM